MMTADGPPPAAAPLAAWRGSTQRVVVALAAVVCVSVLPYAWPFQCGAASLGLTCSVFLAAHAVSTAWVTVAVPPWLWALACTAQMPLLLVATVVYRCRCYGPDVCPVNGTAFNPLVFGIVSGAWAATSTAACYLVDAGRPWFWRAKDLAYVAASTFGLAGVAGAVDPATDAGLIVGCTVMALAVVVLWRVSPTPRVDVAWLVAAWFAAWAQFLGGVQIHYCTAPVYLLVPLRHWPPAAGVVLGVSTHGLIGPGGWPLFSGGRTV